MRQLLAVIAFLVTGELLVRAQIGANIDIGGGGGGPAVCSAGTPSQVVYVGAGPACTASAGFTFATAPNTVTVGDGATGTLTINTTGATNASITESALDKASAGAETFNFTNSGAGAMTLQVDGATVPTVSGPPVAAQVAYFSTASNIVGSANMTFNGTVLALNQDGTALLPSLTFGTVADPNTGLWHPLADTLAVSTAGVERVNISGIGDVAIGRAGTLVTTGVPLWVTPIDGWAAESIQVAEYSPAGSNYPAELVLRRARGTKAIPLVVQSGDRLGRLTFGGVSDAVDNWSRAASIMAEARVTFTLGGGGDSSTDLLFMTARPTVVGAVESMRIRSEGNVHIAIDGTAALPALVWGASGGIGDTNTGIWHPAADTLAISTAGAQRFTVNPAGGVSCPAVTLTMGPGAGRPTGVLEPATSCTHSIVCSDADGCDVTVGKVGAIDGMFANVCTITQAGLTTKVADVGGTFVGNGYLSATGMAANGCFTVTYQNSQWIITGSNGI